MKTSFALTLLLCFGMQQAVLAQEYAGNWWINPQTRQVEGIGEDGNTSRAREGGRTQSDWVAIGQVAGGDTLYGKITRVRQMPGRSPEVILHSRIERIGLPDETGRYAANCVEGGLIRLSDAELDASFAVPTLPDTVGGVLYDWACQ